MASLDSEKPDAEIGNEPENEKAGMHYYYSNRIWRCFANLFHSNVSNLPTRNSNPCLRSLTAAFRKRRYGLPILLHSNAVRSSPFAVEASKLCIILEDIKEHTLSNLHQIHKSLAFWQARAMETDFQKMWFMVFNRGPLAFIHQSFQIIKRLSTNGHPYEHISGSAYETISSKIIILTTLQRCLAAFLAQVYLEVNKFGELLIADPEKSLPTLLKAVDCLFCKLEASINQSCEVYNVNNDSFSTESRNSCVLIFLKLPNMERIQTQWEECEIRDAASLIQENLQRLQAFLSILLSRCQKPNRMAAFWFHYTCGAVLFSTFSFWVLRHSRLMGSSDIDNWILAAKESTTTFWEEHVEQPLISIRDDLFETFRKRHKGVMEIEEVQLTSSSLHRMLLAFSEQTKGQKVPENLTDQEMMEIVMSRYEKELMHPLQNLISGELARAMLIQIQKLKLDLETAMLELDQILKANEINFAVLAALPAFFISLILLFLVRTWVFQDKGAEGRGRIARIRRRLLLVEVEDWIMQYQACLEEGTEEDAGWMLGMMLYSLDLLCKAVEKNAKDTHEWPRLRQDIIKLMKPEVKIDHKLAVILRMGRMYDCLLPFSRQR